MRTATPFDGGVQDHHSESPVRGSSDSSEATALVTANSTLAPFRITGEANVSLGGGTDSDSERLNGPAVPARSETAIKYVSPRVAGKPYCADDDELNVEIWVRLVGDVPVKTRGFRKR